MHFTQRKTDEPHRTVDAFERERSVDDGQQPRDDLPHQRAPPASPEDVQGARLGKDSQAQRDEEIGLFGQSGLHVPLIARVSTRVAGFVSFLLDFFRFCFRLVNGCFFLLNRQKEKKKTYASWRSCVPVSLLVTRVASCVGV